MAMAKVVRFHEIGGPEVLKIEEVDIPPPGRGEVQIRIKALGLNRAEVMFRTGNYLSAPRFRPGTATRRPARWPTSVRGWRASRSATR